eukprot:scaffold11149_cov129-Isochrysis_galbana.AAC.4
MTGGGGLGLARLLGQRGASQAGLWRDVEMLSALCSGWELVTGGDDGVGGGGGGDASTHALTDSSRDVSRDASRDVSGDATRDASWMYLGGVRSGAAGRQTCGGGGAGGASCVSPGPPLSQQQRLDALRGHLSAAVGFGYPAEAARHAAVLFQASEPAIAEWLRVSSKGEEMCRLLRDHFETNPTSCVIAFVARRDTVSAVCAVLQGVEEFPAGVGAKGVGAGVGAKDLGTGVGSEGLGAGAPSYPLGVSQQRAAGDGATTRKLIRPAAFVGQAKTAAAGAGGTDAGAVGMDQAEQQRVLASFRSGEVNVLVATSVAEEGLDIGQVDLLVCFDAVTSPVRLVQRFGRTGRRRDGTCVLLLTEAEERQYEATRRRAHALEAAVDDGRAVELCAADPAPLPQAVADALRCRFVDGGPGLCNVPPQASSPCPRPPDPCAHRASPPRPAGQGAPGSTQAPGLHAPAELALRAHGAAVAAGGAAVASLACISGQWPRPGLDARSDGAGVLPTCAHSTNHPGSADPPRGQGRPRALTADVDPPAKRRAVAQALLLLTQVGAGREAPSPTHGGQSLAPPPAHQPSPRGLVSGGAGAGARRRRSDTEGGGRAGVEERVSLPDEKKNAGACEPQFTVLNRQFTVRVEPAAPHAATGKCAQPSIAPRPRHLPACACEVAAAPMCPLLSPGADPQAPLPIESKPLSPFVKAHATVGSNAAPAFATARPRPQLRPFAAFV